MAGRLKTTMSLQILYYLRDYSLSIRTHDVKSVVPFTPYG